MYNGTFSFFEFKTPAEHIAMQWLLIKGGLHYGYDWGIQTRYAFGHPEYKVALFTQSAIVKDFIYERLDTRTNEYAEFIHIKKKFVHFVKPEGHFTPILDSAVEDLHYALASTDPDFLKGLLERKIVINICLTSSSYAKHLAMVQLLSHFGHDSHIKVREYSERERTSTRTIFHLFVDTRAIHCTTDAVKWGTYLNDIYESYVKGKIQFISEKS